MKINGFLAVGLGLLVMGPAALKAEDQTVQEKSYVCLGCHGEVAEGMADLGAPRLAGQHPDYLVEQTVNFRDGRRGAAVGDTRGGEMRTSVEGMSDADIVALAAYFGNLEAPLASIENVSGDIASGKQLYEGSCASCHGYEAKGSMAVYAPNLALLGPWYIKDQMQAYQNGWRGGEDSTTRAKFMRSIARQITTPEQLDDLVAYIASLRDEPS